MTRKLPAKTNKLSVKLTADQRRLIEQRADQRGLPVGTWMRSILVQAATRPANNGHLRIKEPDGAMT